VLGAIYALVQGAARVPVFSRAQRQPDILPRALSARAEPKFRFEPNRGQAPDGVDFIARGGQRTLRISAAANHFTARDASGAGVVLESRFSGARGDVPPEALRPLPGRINHLIGDAAHWLRDLPTFRGVRYREIYPGIDVVYYGAGAELEYDLVIHPGADPRKVSLEFSGADRVEVDGEGRLAIQVAGRTLHQNAPVSYQSFGSEERRVASRFVVTGSRSVGFELGPRDETAPLVIDPVIAYSTFVGGPGGEDARVSVATDASGAVYMAGTVSDQPPGFPVKNPLHPFGGQYDAYVVKLDPTGSSLVFATHLGGTDWDFAQSIAVDSSSNVYVAGNTASADFPVKNPYHPATTGHDGFVTKIAASGSELVYSSFVPGGEVPQDIALDPSGALHIVGTTSAPEFIVKNAFQPALKANSRDGYVIKLAADGTPVYSTFLGGSDPDGIEATAVGPNGDLFLFGTTRSSDFPVLQAFQPASAGGRADAFVASISRDGTALRYSTYLGGSSIEESWTSTGIEVDDDGSAYVIGTTDSADFPTTPGAFQRSSAGGREAFVAKVAPGGARLDYASFLGGGGEEYGTGIALDRARNAYVVGSTNSFDFPAVDALQKMPRENREDGFVAKIDPAGGRLVYATAFGGFQGDYATDVALDGNGNAWIGGFTQSPNFPRVAPLQPAFGGGGSDAFLTKISEGTQVPSDLWLDATPVTHDAASREVVRYRIAVGNDGSGTATNVELNDVLSETICLVAVTTTQGTCTGSRTLRCDLGSLGPGARAELELDVMSYASGDQVHHFASVHSATPETNLENNMLKLMLNLRSGPARAGCAAIDAGSDANADAPTDTGADHAAGGTAGGSFGSGGVPADASAGAAGNAGSGVAVDGSTLGPTQLSPADEAGGCGCRTARRASSSAYWVPALLLLAFTRRRRLGSQPSF
jgi:uncharacterized repeat protein (TIGR01451 family)